MAFTKRLLSRRALSKPRLMPHCGLLGLVILNLVVIVVLIVLNYVNLLKLWRRTVPAEGIRALSDQSPNIENLLGLNDRETLLADRVRDLEDKNAMLKRHLSLSQKQLMSYAAVRPESKKLDELPVDGDDGDSGGGGGGGADEEEDGEEVGQKRKAGERPCAGGRGDHLVPKCEVVHVSVVCAGADASRSVVTLVKSLLFYRKHPVHFHFVVDPAAKLILGRLFQTWKIPQLEVSLYLYSAVEDDVTWIPNKHYSGIYGLLKLTLPKLLPRWLSKVIVLDTDVTLATDISRLWAEFRNLSPDAALGLVENQSDWYIPGKIVQDPWPALGRGFNTGVILMHLERLRQYKWQQLWRSVAEKELLTLYSTYLADQDIFNAVIKQQPHLVERLSCQWNLQLSDNTRSASVKNDDPDRPGELCYSSLTSGARDVNLVHFNSPHKLNAKKLVKHFDFFRNHYFTFQQYDGNLLRRLVVTECHGGEEKEAVQGETSDAAQEGEEEDDEEEEEDEEEDEGCYELKRARNTVFRTHLYFLDSDLPAADSPLGATDVTLVAQLSMDRLHMIELLCQRWNGSLSLALYLSDAETQQLVSFVRGSSVLRDRRNVGYHVVYREGGLLYPVNALRNVALEAVRTPFVFLSDADFLPGGAAGGDAHEAFSSAVGQLLAGQENKKVALVVPALETHRYRLPQFPRSKAEAIELLDLGTLLTFRYHVWSRGHQVTNYGKWRTATKPYRVRWEQDFEPYVVVSSDVVRYDARFVGFGWNKVSHIMELSAQEYEFVVLPNVFAVHMPHAPSLDIARFRSSDQYRKCLKALKEEFVEELNQRYATKYQT